MLIFLLIYVLGVIAYLVTLWIGYHKLDNGTEITLLDLVPTICMGVWSWIGFTAEIILLYGDTIVFKKK